MRAPARLIPLVLLLAGTLASVLPATAGPNQRATAPTHVRFSFHITANPNSRYEGGRQVPSASR